MRGVSFCVLESGITGVKARSVNENEQCPTSCLTGRVTAGSCLGGGDKGEKETSGRGEEEENSEVREE